MNGRVAKRLRRIAYGDYTTNPAGRKYFFHKLKEVLFKGGKHDVGHIVSDERRREYKRIKKQYKRGLNGGIHTAAAKIL